MKMAYKAMQQELRQIQSRYPSLLNAKYLLEEIKLCERYLSDYPELADEQYKDIVATSPAALANSARLLLLNGRANEIKHRTLPLFCGWSKSNIETASTSNQPIPNKVKESYLSFVRYRKQIGELHEELVAEIN